MNHIALGVSDIQAAEKQLRGWPGAVEPQLGCDGKRPLNLYDLDGTRVERMDFTPATEPCCSWPRAAHPGPNK